MGGDCGLVYKVINPTLAIEGTGILFLEVARGVHIFRLHYFGIVGGNDLLKVGCCPVGHFHSVLVYDFVEGVVFWEMLLQEFEKNGPSFCFDIG